MFLCTSRFDIEEQEARLPKEFFSYVEIEAAKEEKDKKLNEIEVDPISETKEQETTTDDKIELDKALSTVSKEQTVPESQMPLPGNNTQVRASGRKLKSREDDIFEYH
jgi:hypothetical protein